MSDEDIADSSDESSAEVATQSADEPASVSDKTSQEEIRSRRPVIGAVMIAIGLVMLYVVWGALPSRWWPVDVVGTSVALISIAAGIGLVQGAAWGLRLGRFSAGVSLATGLITTSLLAFTASGLWGLYGPVGQGGAVLLFFVALAVVPYLVLLPAAHLYALRSARPTT